MERVHSSPSTIESKPPVPSPELKSLAEAVSAFGAAAKLALTNPAIQGEREEQLRTPLVALVKALAKLAGLGAQDIQLVGETKLSDLMVRPDFAVTRHGALIGLIEVKAPGKGADPTEFKDKHDREQWAKLKALPNLIYTDGNAFSLWQNGKFAVPMVKLDGDVEPAGKNLMAPPELQALFDAFTVWDPIPPRTPQQLAEFLPHAFSGRERRTINAAAKNVSRSVCNSQAIRSVEMERPMNP